MIDTATNPSLKEGIQEICAIVVNPMIAEFGTLVDVGYTNGLLTCTLTLLGMEDVPLTVTCSSITIADDASTVTLGGFSANKPFLQNALNTFASKPFPIPNTPLVRASIKILKGLLA